MKREEAIKLLVNATYSDEWQGNEDLTTVHNMAIKAIKQEPILEKIRAEIENRCGLAKKNHCKTCPYCNFVMGIREILEIIDKYNAESEVKE